MVAAETATGSDDKEPSGQALGARPDAISATGGETGGGSSASGGAAKSKGSEDVNMGEGDGKEKENS